MAVQPASLCKLKTFTGTETGIFKLLITHLIGGGGDKNKPILRGYLHVPAFDAAAVLAHLNGLENNNKALTRLGQANRSCAGSVITNSTAKGMALFQKVF